MPHQPTGFGVGGTRWCIGFVAIGSLERGFEIRGSCESTRSLSVYILPCSAVCVRCRRSYLALRQLAHNAVRGPSASNTPLIHCAIAIVDLRDI